MRHVRSSLWAAAIAAGFLVTGCSLVTAAPGASQQASVPIPAARGAAIIGSSLASMAKRLHTYQIKAEETLVSGTHTSVVNYFGSFSLPDSLDLDETLAGVNYRIVQLGSRAYVGAGSVYAVTRPIPVLTPWTGLSRLLAADPPKSVAQLPDQTILSWICNVYQFTEPVPSGWLGVSAASPSPGLPKEALYTVWIDRQDNDLRQLEIQSTTGISGIGTVAMTAVQTYDAFNAPVHVSLPKSVS